MKLVILILAFNEEASLPNVIRRIPTVLPGIDDICCIVIDDGSKDRTAEVARELGCQVISHWSNQGVGQAFQTGLKAALEAGADVMVNIDGDGQFLPEEIPLLIKPVLDEHVDFVPADRFSDENGILSRPEYMSPLKYWGNKVMSNLIGRLTGRCFNDVSCGFRAYSRESMLQLNLTGRFTYTQESFLDLSFKNLRIQPMPVTVRYFPDRKSRVASNLFRYTFRTLNIIFRAYRDYQPLRFFAFLGLIPFVPGVLAILAMLSYFIETGVFTPYKSVGIVGIYLFSVGLLLFIVGILADMFMRLRQNQEKILYFEKCRYYSREKQSKQDNILIYEKYPIQ